MIPTRMRFAGVWALALAATLAACGDDDGSGPTPVDPPTGLAVEQVGADGATVSWTAADGATGYLVQRAGSDDPGNFATLGGGPVDGTSFDDTGLETAIEYSYRVASVSATDTSSFAGPVTLTLGGEPGEAVDTISEDISASRTLFADTLYVLSGYVKVLDGATLTVEAGTRIVGDSAVTGSSLWILRGAKIEANGTAAAPIVFTSALSAGDRKPGDWGGIIIIGNGTINRTGATILTEGGAAGEAENYAGGNDDDDDSGTLRYVRIEFAGFDVSNGGGQELNTLSSYAVGRGTTYEYIESMAGLDDAFEWWGGAVDARYLVSYESGDDHFDWTEGYRGRNQFLIAFQNQRLLPDPDAGVVSADPRGFEGDGCDPAVAGCTLTDNGASAPYSMPVFANFTMVGPAPVAGWPDDGNGAVLRRGTGGTLFNGVLGRWKGIALNIKDAWTDTLFEQRDSLNIANLVLAGNGANFDPPGSNFAQETKFGAENAIQAFDSDVQVDTLLGITITPTGLDWTPKAGSPVDGSGSAQVPANFTARTANFFGGQMEQTDYIGAADPAGAKWWDGWTSYETE
jgi:hypothetical protein